MTTPTPGPVEPIPGYRLIERLGGGGFGEVWKAEAPGGFMKAIKIVHGTIDQVGADAPSQADQELKALKRVLAVRHPYLLSLERFDIIDGRLYIVMELADCNLWDRFRECRNQGHGGIPRDDLLRYMQEAAEVLDLMNGQYQLQHLDIKPQNLFLIHDHVKVADFGLVKDLEGVRASITGGVTPVYAAPETFDGVVTRFCDQYSLAIVYQELLTGQRPFNGVNVQQLIMQHLRGTPNLSTLPPADRIVLMRALAKTPEERFPTCLAMVRALQTGVVAPAGGASGVVPRPDLPRAGASGVVPRPGVSGAVPRPNPLPPPTALQPASTPATLVRLKREDHLPAPEPVTPARVAPPEVTGDGCLMPAVVVGLGRLGLAALRQFRHAVAGRFGSAGRLPCARTVFIDTDPDTAAEAGHGPGDALAAEDVVLARLNRASHYLRPRRNGHSLIEGWFDPQMLYRIPRNPATLGLRCLGRLAFLDHFRAINQKLRQELDTASHPDTLSAADRHTRLGLRTNRPRCYVVAGLGGGTGSGMFLDAAYTLRHRLRLAGYADGQTEVVGLLLLPPAEKALTRPPAPGNAYAALVELHHYSLPETVFAAAYDDRDAAVRDARPPFDRFFVLAPQSGGRTPEWLAAELLARELAAPFGRAVDAARADRARPPEPGRDPVAARTFGLTRISWPRAALVEDAAREVCRRVLARWTAGGAGEVRDAVGGWVREQWAGRKLGSEHLIGRLQEECGRAAGDAPEALFQAMTGPFVPRSFWSRPAVERPAVLDVLGRIEALVGTPGESGIRRQTGKLSEVVQAVAERVLKESGSRLAQMAVQLIEQPDFRLAGAEEAINQFKGLFDQVLDQYEPTVLELARQAADAHARVHDLIAPERGRRLSGGDIADALRLYGTWRYQFLVLKQVTNVYASLRGQVTDALREVAYCRDKLAEMAERFARRDRSPPADSQLLPDGCATPAEASRRLTESFGDDDLRGLDRRLQAAIEEQFTALVHVCMSSSGLVGSLEAVMLQQAREYVGQRLGEVDLASMFLARYPDPAAATAALARAYEDATPALGRMARGGSDTLDVLALPPHSPLEELARRALPGLDYVAVPGREEIAVYREVPRLELIDLPQAGPSAEDAYKGMLESAAHPPHLRTDVEEWLPLDPG